MASGNTVTVVGNLTRDPELQFLKNGSPLANFGLAYNRRWKNRNDEWEEEAHFFEVTCWQDLAENVAESFTKGDRVIIEGRLQYSTWEDKDTGANRSKVAIIADDVGASARWATLQITRNEREDNNNSSQGHRRGNSGNGDNGGGSRRGSSDGGGSRRGQSNGGGSRRGSTQVEEPAAWGSDEEPF